MAIQITAYANRASSHLITFKDVDDANITIVSGDKVRIKIGRTGATPLLDIVSGTNTSSGGSVSAANPATLTLKKGDVAADVMKPGVYDIEASIVDSTDNQIKHAETGIFAVITTPGGETT